MLTPVVTIVGVLIITLVGALDDGITDLQLRGLWWILVIIGYILSLGYILYKPIFQKNQNRKTLVFMSILYWEEQLAKRNKPKPTEYETEMMRKYIINRMEIMALFDPELWDRRFPNEKYTESLFELVDNYLKIENNYEPF